MKITTRIPLKSQAPYNLMLTESADVHLDLPFRSLEDVAASIAQALKDIGERAGA
jgi:hypothetical protein